MYIIITQAGGSATPQGVGRRNRCNRRAGSDNSLPGFRSFGVQVFRGSVSGVQVFRVPETWCAGVSEYFA